MRAQIEVSKSEEVACEITAPHFVAGVVLNLGIATVHRAARMLHYLVGWPFQAVLDYCTHKRWSW